MYIAFEGTIGTGKTTQSKKLVEHLKTTFPEKEFIWTREPGGTEISEAIRKVVQGTQFDEEMEQVCEVYLYAASRAQSLRQIVRPALDRNAVVIADRSFLTALTNQAYGRELGFERVYEINKHTIDGIIPDYIFYFDLPISIGMRRSFDAKGDKFESLGEDFYTRVYNGYKEVSQIDMFKNKWVNIDANGTEEEVFNKTLSAFLGVAKY